MNHKEMVSRLLQPHMLAVQPSPEQLDVPNVQYSAVAIILRNMGTSGKISQLDAILSTELLLLQRVDNGKMYAGEICLPGGKKEKGETIIQAAVRETEEQTGVRLKKEEFIGVLNESFVAFKRATNSLLVYAVVFYQSQAQPITINPEEMADYRWVSLRYFMKEEVYQPIIVPFETLAGLLQEFDTTKEIKHFEWPAIDVGMSKNLYGLTLYILSYLMTRFEKTLEKSIKKLITSVEKMEGQKKAVLLNLGEKLKEVQKYEQKIRELCFQGMGIRWKEQCSLDQAEKTILLEEFHKRFKQMFPERPRF